MLEAALRGSMVVVAAALLLACPSDPGESGGPGSTGSDTTDPGTTGSSSGSTGPAASTSSGEVPGTTGVADSSGTGSDTAVAESSSSGSSETSDGSSSGGAAPGLGELSGQCGLVDAMELTSPSAFTFGNAIDFRDLGFDYDMLTPEGQQVFDAGNLGGSSLHSEVISFEVLARCEGASLLATEGDIVYLDDMGIKTDLLVEIDGLPVGVSVTRAVAFPFGDPYTVMQAEALLTNKLGDILASSANVAPRNAWVKQILHVIAYADMHAQSIFTAYAGLPPEITADTILLVTVTDGNDAFIY